MASDYFEVDQEVIDTARMIMQQYLPDLLNAKIGFIFRSEAPKQNGRVTLGKAQKVSSKDRMFNNLDFIIWIAEDTWEELSPLQRRALVHHELLHCRFLEGEASMRGHDVEEFWEIIQRYGFWSKSLQNGVPAMEKAMEQMKLPFGEEVRHYAGELVAIKPGQIHLVAVDDE